MLGKLSELQIERFLQSQIVGRIGCHANGETYVVPISYAYDGTYIYARTYEGKKLDMMREEPRICFEVDTLRDLSEWKSVIGWGEFEELKDPDERKTRVTNINGSQFAYIIQRNDASFTGLAVSF
jgi:nitroimidazol reductase NimA-like FMN-containing flavoprotein (pyridoxamine 5'-phosphate oxidase superfamily)